MLALVKNLLFSKKASLLLLDYLLNPSNTSKVLAVNFYLWHSTYCEYVREYGLFFQGSQLEMNLNYFIYATMAWPLAPIKFSYAYSTWWQISLTHKSGFTILSAILFLAGKSKAVINTSCLYSGISLSICTPLV